MSVHDSERVFGYVDRIVKSVLRAVDPAALTERWLRMYPPRSPGAVIAVGKAAAGMYRGYIAACGEPGERFMILPTGSEGPEWALRGEHPVPTQANVRAAEALRSFVGEPSRGRAGFTLLLSGGASALMALPGEGLSIEDLGEVTRDLLRAGADIRELNWVRKHLEQFKGGRLAALVCGEGSGSGSPCHMDVYVLSDVIGDDLSVIGSGPAWPDGSTYAGAIEILDRRGIEAPAARRYLDQGAAGKKPETPKPGDPVFKSVRTGIIGNNATAVEAARAAAEEFGFRTRPLSRALTGEARDEAASLVRMLPPRGLACLVGGGETTVRVGDSKGVGGRNQELALAAALAIEGETGAAIASFATDGVDGPTDAAGAVVTSRTCTAAKEAGLHPGRSLDQHDSHGFFRSLEEAGHRCLLRTGPTGTNVNDVTLVLRF